MDDPPRLSEHQMRLLRDSLNAIAPRSEELTRIFYQRLFALDPSLRLLFRRDMSAQRDKWIGTLTALFINMHEPEQVAPAARHLGRRHRQYGVHAADYHLAGKALLWALQHLLEDRFTPELGDTWATAFAHLAHLMQQVDDDMKRPGL